MPKFDFTDRMHRMPIGLWPIGCGARFDLDQVARGRLPAGGAMMAHPAPRTHPRSKQTPLHALHLAMGARMAPFAGYDMPIHYPLGVLKEHLHTRSAAGLFDVSHMGQIAVRPRSGRMADAARALERVVPVDVLSLAPGRQRYAFFTNSSGGIIDDLMIGHCGESSGACRQCQP